MIDLWFFDKFHMAFFRHLLVETRLWWLFLLEQNYCVCVGAIRCQNRRWDVKGHLRSHVGPISAQVEAIDESHAFFPTRHVNERVSGDAADTCLEMALPECHGPLGFGHCLVQPPVTGSSYTVWHHFAGQRQQVHLPIC